MNRIGYLIGAASIACSLMITDAVKTTFAGASCCGSKEAAAAENKCAVCGKEIEKGKGITAECDGKKVTLCCKGCEDAMKKGAKNGTCCEKEEHHH